MIRSQGNSNEAALRVIRERKEMIEMIQVITTLFNMLMEVEFSGG